MGQGPRLVNAIALPLFLYLFMLLMSWFRYWGSSEYTAWKIQIDDVENKYDGNTTIILIELLANDDIDMTKKQEILIS